ncbi:hypothetical protein ACFOTA_06890 [Chitinophaga sp. GCM10012297]|uniref:Uncharacterized protein n=1 Tax=Chitinophaga chungangae TaxID=2821488 RepID=A0ABS3YB69_9BACT|nr:hypothetical protein [Chitinophaga chungangae]MBO9151925.1 hypothetical protein [Chitinophaga chungangae]
MAELNKLECEKKVKNTGYGKCPVDFLAFIGGFLAPIGLVLTKAQLADLQATFQSLVLADIGQRIFPFHGWEGVTPNTHDPTFAAMPSGRQVFVKEGDIDVTYQFLDVGLCLSNRMRSFNNDFSYGLFRYDEEFKLQGTTKLDADGNPGLAPIPLKVNYTYPVGENDFTNPSIYRSRYSFAPNYVNENVGFVQADSWIKDIKGLVDIGLTISGTPTGGVYQVLPLAGCSQTNLFDQYSAALAVAGLWKMYNVATGNEIDIDSVAANAGLKAITVTADTADPDYTAATATGKVRIELADAAALDAADITGYEGIPLTVVRGV